MLITQELSIAILSEVFVNKKAYNNSIQMYLYIFNELEIIRKEEESIQ